MTIVKDTNVQKVANYLQENLITGTELRQISQKIKEITQLASLLDCHLYELYQGAKLALHLDVEETMKVSDN